MYYRHVIVRPAEVILKKLIFLVAVEPATHRSKEYIRHLILAYNGSHITIDTLCEIYPEAASRKQVL